MHIHKPNAFFIMLIVVLVLIPVLFAFIIRTTLNPLAPKYDIVVDTSAKNVLSVSKIDERGEVVGSKRIRFLNLATFNDVPPGYWAAKQISLLSTLGIVKGYPDDTFKPKRNVTRSEMAVILIRAKDINNLSPPTPIFQDIPAHYWAAKDIYLAEQLGLIQGYPDGTFRPNHYITRAEGLAMVSRFAYITSAPYENQFPDVAPSHWIAGPLAGALKAGLLRYLENQPFRPNQPLTRAEAVEMLIRTEAIKRKIAGFLNLQTDSSGKTRGFLSKEKALKLLDKIKSIKTTTK